MANELFVIYPGELSDDDRRALQRPGWKLYENGAGTTATYTYSADEMPPVKWRQVVRVPTGDREEARQLVIDALGREPEGLRVCE